VSRLDGTRGGAPLSRRSHGDNRRDNYWRDAYPQGELAALATKERERERERAGARHAPGKCVIVHRRASVRRSLTSDIVRGRIGKGVREKCAG